MKHRSGAKVLAYIGLGSNLNNPVQQVRKALLELNEIPDTHCVQYSSLYRTRPMGPGKQPDYINAVAVLETGLDEHALLRGLQKIEQEHQRVRDEHWGPRTLDLDILLYGNKEIAEEDLKIPHPGMHIRPFVLYPLVEIAPDLTIPGKGSVRELAGQLDSSDEGGVVERINEQS